MLMLLFLFCFLDRKFSEFFFSPKQKMENVEEGKMVETMLNGLLKEMLDD